MKKLLSIIITVVLSTSLLSCGSGNKSQAFIPSAHRVTIDRASYNRSNIREGYHAYNREEILKMAAADDRYEGLIENARNTEAQLVSMSDEELRAMIPPGNTIRALMVHRKGCPVHGGGTAVYQPFGTRVNIDYPLQVKCPIGGEVYPNDDFPDDGSGWIDNRPDSPTKGEKYYFVGWFNHWFLQQVPGHVKRMAQLWFLTGEEVYSQKARVLIKRFMEVYPAMDGHDLTYDGTDWGVYVKMLPTMWEGTALTNMTTAVELLLSELDDDFIRRFHANVFRPAFDAYRKQPAPSNWGNVWNPPFARFADITGEMDYLDYMLNEHPVAAAPTLDNQYFRDGFPYEAAFSYGSHYIYDSRNISDMMGVNGNWVWEHPNMRESFKAFAEIVCLDRFTHFFGDSGSIFNRGLTIRPDLLEEGFRRYKSPIVARYLLQAYELHGTARSVSIDGLFAVEKSGGEKTVDMDEVRKVAAQAEPLKSTLAPVRGFAVMRTGEGDARTELFFDFGYAHAAHSHADRLNVNIFARDREFVPEMGYPEYMDSIAPTPGGWTTHTVSHATVEVDEKRQLEGVFGDLHGFVHADGIKYVDASCEDAYVHCGVNLYRRTLALIDVPGGAYVVDIFRVGGGRQHDYLFHGPPVDFRGKNDTYDYPNKIPPTEFKLDNVNLSVTKMGTLAGETIAFGEKPDDVLPYHVDNKGYQYLFDVQECEKDSPYSASWTMEDGVRFSATFVPDGPETFYLTKGLPRPSSKTYPPLPFLVRRKVQEDADGSDGVSQFATVMSIDNGEPLVIDVERIAFTQDSSAGAHGLRIVHKYGEDVVISNLTTDGHAISKDGNYELEGQFGVATRRNVNDVQLTLIGGTEFSVDGNAVRSESPGTEATVVQVHDNKLVLDKPLPPNSAGQVMFAERSPVRSSYWIEKTEGTTVYVSPGTWIGKGRVDRYDSDARTVFDNRDIFPLGEKRNRLADITGMKYPEGNRNYYAGSWMVSEAGGEYYRLSSGGFPGFVLDWSQELSGLERDFPVGSDFLLYDLGPGDRVWTMGWRQEGF